MNWKKFLNKKIMRKLIVLSNEENYLDLEYLGKLRDIPRMFCECFNVLRKIIEFRRTMTMNQKLNKLHRLKIFDFIFSIISITIKLSSNTVSFGVEKLFYLMLKKTIEFASSLATVTSRVFQHVSLITIFNSDFSFLCTIEWLPREKSMHRHSRQVTLSTLEMIRHYDTRDAEE